MGFVGALQPVREQLEIQRSNPHVDVKNAPAARIVSAPNDYAIRSVQACRHRHLSKDRGNRYFMGFKGFLSNEGSQVQVSKNVFRKEINIAHTEPFRLGNESTYLDLFEEPGHFGFDFLPSWILVRRSD